ncbi:MAG: Lysine exporter protein [Bacteroidota bacterium]|nr:Lysine exporter protein [Bacteroidota bacterium]
MDVIIKGILSGITISLLIGPIFIALVDITLTKGWRSALFYVSGVIISDIVLIYFLNELLSVFVFDQYKLYVGWIGGLVLLMFGAITFFANPNVEHANIENIKTYFGAFFKGVTINVLNPFVVLFWVGIYSTLATFNYSNLEKAAYYGSLLSMVVVFDMLKIRFAYFLKYRFSTQKLSIVKKVAGVCLFVFGIVMIVKVMS